MVELSCIKAKLYYRKPDTAPTLLRSLLWQWVAADNARRTVRNGALKGTQSIALMDATHMFWVCLKAWESDWKAVWHLLCCLLPLSEALHHDDDHLWVKLRLQVIHLIPTAWSCHWLPSEMLLNFLSQCFTEFITLLSTPHIPCC